ncbi:hypothetical protein [Algoriphagus hitonicola]|uniref:TolB-like 6-blade propeller-like n=1 Tax=Algoriphagus hitonicola TaxID=435880 RepID=A0A1I2NM37_9BACT|nr:hypothetical protein [Algoriphagus hitonicola]SFG04902.1 hypothetical protein SAMN04487988_101205 [Algoriphagus hitonicola]
MRGNLQIILKILFASWILGAFSCDSEQKSTESVEDSTYQLVKIDSFEVENFTQVLIRDYSSEEKRYLGYSMVEDEILEISESGEILKRVKKKGEGPGLYGNWNPIGLGFGPDGLRVAELPFEIYTYDSAYEVVYQQRIQSPLPIRTFGPMGKPPYFEHEDSTFFLVGPTNYLSAHYLIRDEEGRDTLQNFYKINIQNGDMKSVIPYQENSIYFESENIYQELMTKSFLIDEESDELLLLHSLEDEIEIYELPNLNLKRTIPINHRELLRYAPLPIETPGNDERVNKLRFMAGRNLDLIKIDANFYLLKYFTGVSEAEYQTRNENDALYSPLSDPDEQGILLIKNQKQLPFELPSIQGKILFGLDDGKFLVQEALNPEVEEEVTRFGIYQIQEN